MSRYFFFHQIWVILLKNNFPFSSPFFFNFIFKFYIIVLVLPNIKMNPPQVYMCLMHLLCAWWQVLVMSYISLRLCWFSFITFSLFFKLHNLYLFIIKLTSSSFASSDLLWVPHEFFTPAIIIVYLSALKFPLIRQRIFNLFIDIFYLMRYCHIVFFTSLIMIPLSSWTYL